VGALCGEGGTENVSGLNKRGRMEGGRWGACRGTGESIEVLAKVGT
jgi:hypothetical protein